MYGATIGKASILGIPATTNQACAAAQINQEIINTDFLYHYLSSQQSHFVTLGKGGAQPNISQTILKDHPINLPPLNEQKRIAAKIEALFTEIDQGIESIKLAQRQLKTYRQSILKHAFEGKLTEKWREAQNDNQDKWQWVKLSDIATVSGGLTKNSKRSSLSLQRPFLRVANVYSNELRLDDIHTIGLEDNELTRVSLQQGDLLVVEGNGSKGQIGRVAVWNNEIENCVHQNHLIKVRPSLLLDSRYAVFYLSSPAGRSMIEEISSSTSGLYTLNLSKVKEFQIPLCPLTEQQEIVRESEARFTEIDQLEITLQASLQQAESLRQSILKAAFAGKLVEQDPADEPAEVLLHIIKSGKS
jgi:type I restriction enzyme S subunit